MTQQTVIRNLRTEDYVDYLHHEATAGATRSFPWQVAGTALLLCLFLYLGPLLWQLDATAAVPDIGLLGLLLFAALAVSVGKLLSAWLCFQYFKGLVGIDRQAIRSSFQSLPSWLQTGYYLLLLLSLFWGSVVVLVTIL